MKKFNVKITKARIESINIDYENENLPDVCATLGCYTEDDKKITTFNATTKNYYSGIKFKIPVTMVQSLVDLADIIEKIVIKESKKEFLKIAAPKEV